MAHDKDKIYNKALEQIEKHELFFIEDIVAFLPCSKTYFYEAFPIDSNEMNNIKELLEENKIKKKSQIRMKLYKSDKAAELLALYRLIATPDEHRRLNQSYMDHTTKGESLNKPLSQDEIDKANDELDGDI